MILGEPYETSEDSHVKSYLWHSVQYPEPITYDARLGTLTIFIKTKGRSFSPDYNTLRGALQQYSHALLNISIVDWHLDTSVLKDHLKILYFNISRWRAIQFDAQLFNYLVQQREWRKTCGCEIPSSLTSVTLRDLGEACQRDVFPLLGSLRWLFGINKFPHLEIESNGVLEPFGWKQAYDFPFSHLSALHITTPISSLVVYHILVSSAGALQELYVSHLNGPSPPELPTTFVVVPNLRTLRLSLSDIDFNVNRCGSVWGLLRTLIPVGAKLQEVSLGYENFWSSKSFATFCERIGPSGLVGTLRLEKMGMTSHEFLHCLELNPNLFELVVDCQEDRWDGKPTPLLFNKEICDLIKVKPQFTQLIPGLEKLVVRKHCIAKTGRFGQMIESMYTRGSLKELIIAGEDALASLHRQDKKILEELTRTGFSVQFQD